MKVNNYIILTALFAIGALAMMLINRKKTALDRRNNWIKYFTYLLIVNLVINTIIHDSSYFFYLAILISVLSMSELLRALLNSKSVRLAFVVLPIFLLILVGFLYFSTLRSNFLLFTYFVVLMFDAFSQLSGQLVGKTPLAPCISPGKTVEGFIGGLLITTAVASTMTQLTKVDFLHTAFIAVVIALFAFTGDLLASLVKRRLKIKDFGTLLPGHGGVLDRFDSLLLAGALLFGLSLFFD